MKLAAFAKMCLASSNSLPVNDDPGQVRAAEVRPSIPQQHMVQDGRKPGLLVAITLAETGGAQCYLEHLLPALVEHFDVTVAAHGPAPCATQPLAPEQRPFS